MMGNRKLANTAGGGRQKRGTIVGDRMTEKVEVEVIWWRHLISTKSLPYLTSAHPRAAKGPEHIPHAS